MIHNQASLAILSLIKDLFQAAAKKRENRDSALVDSSQNSGRMIIEQNALSKTYFSIKMLHKTIQHWKLQKEFLMDWSSAHYLAFLAMVRLLERMATNGKNLFFFFLLCLLPIALEGKTYQTYQTQIYLFTLLFLFILPFKTYPPPPIFRLFGLDSISQ